MGMSKRANGANAAAHERDIASVEARGMSIGPGMPKTIVSLMCRTDDELPQRASEAVAAGADCLEWRVDFCDSPISRNELMSASAKLREAVPATPIVFTFRSKGEGGQRQMSNEEYAHMCETAIQSGAVDFVDVELRREDDLVRSLVHTAHDYGVLAIVSYHDFEGTPTVDDMVGLLNRMACLGADIPKLAVMAKSSEDALRLMQATTIARESLKKPLLTMAMGREGVLTRLAGEAFGSCLTFCALGSASAPGQVGLNEATRVLQDLHEVFA